MSRPPSTARRVVRRVVRIGLRVLGVLVVVLLGVPLLDAVVPLPGCVPQPALVTRHRGVLREPTLGRGYPRGAVPVYVSVAEDERLAGMFLASDPGAPVVLHLLGSGGSLLDTRLRRPVFADLAAMGFASLLVDWNGVGASEGAGDVRLLRRDVLAMFEEAAARAGGPERVIVRATSLGCLAAAMLLEEGRRPAAVLLVAPVRAETASSHWTRFFFGDFADWLARPWLLPLADVDLLDVLAASDVPVLALSTATDVLFPPDEQRRLADTLQGRGGRLVLDPAYHSDIRGLRIYGLLGRRMTRAESSHFVQAVQARALFVDEVELLHELFAEQTARARVERWRERRGDSAPVVPEALELELAYLLVGDVDVSDAELDLALAAPEPLAALELLQSQPSDTRPAAADALVAWLDLDDPAGALRLTDLRDLGVRLGSATGSPEERLALALWGLARVMTAEDAARAEPTEDATDDGDAVGPDDLVDVHVVDLDADADELDDDTSWTGDDPTAGDGPDESWPSFESEDDADAFVAACRAAWTTSLVLTPDVAGARRQTVRSVLKMLGVAERLVPGAVDDQLEWHDGVAWLPLDLDAALPRLAPERVRGSALWAAAREQAEQRRLALAAGEAVDEILLTFDDDAAP